MDEGGARREGSLLLVVEGVVDLVLQEASVGLHGLGGVFVQVPGKTDAHKDRQNT